jgi:type II protein arginine methyltransferase
MKLRVPSPYSAGEGSPVFDAIDVMDALVERTNGAPSGMENSGGARLVKIGQTALHNPRGRSSWIGL